MITRTDRTRSQMLQDFTEARQAAHFPRKGGPRKRRVDATRAEGMDEWSDRREGCVAQTWWRSLRLEALLGDGKLRSQGRQEQRRPHAGG